MDSILEAQRRAHEEVERLEDLIVKDLMQPMKTHREKLRQAHRVNRHLERIQERSGYLLETYEDKEGQRKAEINAISGATEFSEFYQRLKDVKDYHRRFPNESVEPMELQFMKMEQEQEVEGLEAIFTGEERLGKFLDLNAVFELYINLKNIKKVTYQAFIGEFDKFEEVPAETKSTAEYSKFLDELYAYLVSFCARSKPLYNWASIEEEVINAVKESIEANQDDGEGGDPLFCKPCDKHFAKQTVYDAHLTGKKHKKAAEQLQSGAANGKPAGAKERRAKILEKEALIIRIAQDLEDVRQATRTYLDQKQTLSYDELRKYFDEEQAVEVEESDSESEDGERIYNPLKLPIGWDGKPIPYWLYKLHGLGVEYPCEICGGFIYMGRKAFDRHFQEWKHSNGMKALGIPNTKHFHEITLIADVRALWEKLKAQAKAEAFKAEAMEEFEDAEGNVFNKKTFDDLRRQGLL
ncbi:hypothetical protein DFJ73DRAFT_144259 [Zopfochytrium polystomum]|nr:hypothetical protein DFJ73DRAFT_144259 [Zopfochytrium polystomum]